MFLVAAASSAFAQNAGAAAGAGGVAPGMGGVPPVGTTTTNPGSAGISSAPGVPNTTTPGTIGTGAAPSGLPGDYPAHPGFPAKIGQ